MGDDSMWTTAPKAYCAACDSPLWSEERMRWADGQPQCIPCDDRARGVKHKDSWCNEAVFAVAGIVAFCLLVYVMTGGQASEY